MRSQVNDLQILEWNPGEATDLVDSRAPLSPDTLDHFNQILGITPDRHPALENTRQKYYTRRKLVDI